MQAAVALPVVLFLLVAPPIALENMKGPDMDEAMDEAVGQEEAEEGDTPGAGRPVVYAWSVCACNSAQSFPALPALSLHQLEATLTTLGLAAAAAARRSAQLAAPGILAAAPCCAALPCGQAIHPPVAGQPWLQCMSGTSRASRRAWACGAGAERREEDRPLTQGSPGVWADLRVLGCHPVYMFSMLAACPNSGVFGALSYWGPHVRAARTPELLAPHWEALDMPKPALWSSNVQQAACFSSIVSGALEPLAWVPMHALSTSQLC